MRPILQPPPPLLLLDRFVQAQRLLARQPRRRPAFLSPSVLLPDGLFKELLAEFVREVDDTCAHRGAVAAILALASARRNLFGEIPQSARGDEVARHGVATWTPLGREAETGWDAGILGADDLDDAFFFEALVRVFEGFLVDGLKVAEVALVVEGFPELWGVWVFSEIDGWMG